MPGVYRTLRVPETMPISTTWIGLALAWVLYSIVLVVYRLFFHPLSKFPGPKLAAATSWYEAYYDLAVRPGGQFFHELKRLHRIYGEIDGCYLDR